LPHSRQFPFDEVAEKIVKALEKRNWKVPGMGVEFFTYGRGFSKHTYVHKIEGDDFYLKFHRTQGRLPDGYNDAAAIVEIWYGKEILHVSDDEFGPRLYLYVGDEWEKDKHDFVHSCKVNAKLRGRTYLEYSGGYSRGKNRAKWIINTDDMGCQYIAENGEPKRFATNEKYREFAECLEEILKRILATPEAGEDYNATAYYELPTLIPFEEVKHPLGGVYAYCDGRVYERVEEGQKDPESLEPWKRYVYTGGDRLMRLTSGVEVPEVAYDGFIWAGELKCKDAERYVDITCHWPTLFEPNYLLKIAPKYANDIYVADSAVYEIAREEMSMSIAPRGRLTDDELDACDAVRARSIVPILDYDGSYKRPFMLIRRELDFDEVELAGLVKP
jgi:hypothetical protein